MTPCVAAMWIFYSGHRGFCSNTPGWQRYWRLALSACWAGAVSMCYGDAMHSWRDSAAYKTPFPTSCCQQLLRSLVELGGAVIDNLDRAEKLGLLSSADEWLASDKLRNRMVYEHVRDPAELAEALNQGHSLVPLLLSFATAIASDCQRRGLLGA